MEFSPEGKTLGRVMMDPVFAQGENNRIVAMMMLNDSAAFSRARTKKILSDAPVWHAT